MGRLHSIVLKNLFKIPFLFGRMHYYGSHSPKCTKEEKYGLVQDVVARTIRSGDIEVEVIKKKNIPGEDGFIFFPNHQGMFDGFAMVAANERPFSPVIKNELMDIPVVKELFICLESLPMVREDIRQSIKVMQEVAQRVRRKENCLIFAEGTRSKEGNKVQHFKGGSFKPAVKTKCPVVPVALIDCFKPFDGHYSGHLKVMVCILEPLEYFEYSEMKTNEIAETVKGRIERAILCHMENMTTQIELQEV